MSSETKITEAKGNLFQVKKFVDDLALIDSGVVHFINDSVFTIMLDDFSLNFVIVNDAEEKRRLRIKEQSKKSITLEFVNFDQSNLGAGVLKPTSLFVINGVEIYFTFFIRSLENTQKEFTYTLLSKTNNKE